MKTCKVAAVLGTSVVLNGGATDGVQLGNLFRLRTEVEPITDPITGERLAQVGQVLGLAFVIDVKDRLAVADLSPRSAASICVGALALLLTLSPGTDTTREWEAQYPRTYAED